MTANEALELIRDLCDADTFPKLREDELVRLRQGCRVKDASGYGPEDAEYTPTYSIPYAVMQGWKIKAGRVAGEFDFSDSGQSFSRSQLMKHCLQMKNEYARQVNASAPMPISGATASQAEEEVN